MSYQIKLYCNTGFNSVNIPDVPTLLEQCQNVQNIDALEIISNRTLTGVKVRATMELCQDADYCRIGDFYYSVKGATPLSADVTYLSLTPDYFTSAGGVSNFHAQGGTAFGERRMVILDGVTDRVHVSNDAFAMYAEDDPLCAPAYPLEYECFHYTMESDPEGSFDDNYYSLVESTYDLRSLGDGTARYGTTYTDRNSGEVVTVPDVPINDKGTEFYGMMSTMPVGGIRLANTPYSVVREASGTTTPASEISYTKEGINRTRALGLEAGVSAVTIIPKSAIGPVVNLTDYNLDSITGRNVLTGTGLRYQYANVKNNKVLYSMDTPIAISTPAGDYREWSIYDVYKAGEMAPILRFITDPRLDGRPYFGFKHFRGDESIQTFFTHCVKGDQWRQRPLVFTEASGGVLNELRFNQKNMSDFVAYNAQKNLTRAKAAEKINETYLNMARSSAENIGNRVVNGAMATGRGENGSFDPVAAAYGAITSLGIAAAETTYTMRQELPHAIGLIQASTDRQLVAAQYDYTYGRQKELLEYGIAQSVVPTEILYPLSAELVADMCGQGCMVVRYKYCAADIARIDKLLTMYGYRHTKALEASDFTNRTRFNYIKASVSIGGLPGWWADGVGIQLSNGTRIWHELPNRNAYLDNPIRI